ncbi:hypothetical protein LTR95_008450 [Oleoguttula sp. CCFEE 5521]
MSTREAGANVYGSILPSCVHRAFLVSPRSLLPNKCIFDIPLVPLHAASIATPRSVMAERNPSPKAFTVNEASTPDDIAAVEILFKAYTKWLHLDLTFQGFADELASLPGKYAPPNGALLLARLASFDEAIGCVAIRPLSGGGFCEIKRLYVTFAGRGTGVGKALAVAAIDQARQIGYKAVRLDTLPSMSAARALYESLGFTEIGPYYESPLEGTIFLELIL